MIDEMLQRMAVLIAGVILVGATPPAWAETLSPIPATGLAVSAVNSNDDKWVFSSALYLWAMELSGTATIQGNSASVSLPLDEAFSKMDLGFTAYFDLAKPQYGFYVNLNYFLLAFNGTHAGGRPFVTLDTQAWIVESACYYRILDHAGKLPARLYVVAGGRYWNLHNNIGVNTGSGRNADADTIWLLDPIVGLRLQAYVTKRIHIQGQTDVGGFDLGYQTSRFSWQLMGTVGYDFTMPAMKLPSTVFAGWRQINDQYYRGDGLDKTGYHFNFSGIILGLSCQVF
jgi:hypothetical protein